MKVIWIVELDSTLALFYHTPTLLCSRSTMQMCMSGCLLRLTIAVIVAKVRTARSSVCWSSSQIHMPPCEPRLRYETTSEFLKERADGCMYFFLTAYLPKPAHMCSRGVQRPYQMINVQKFVYVLSIAHLLFSSLRTIGTHIPKVLGISFTVESLPFSPSIHSVVRASMSTSAPQDANFTTLKRPKISFGPAHKRLFYTGQILMRKEKMPGAV